MSAGSGFGPSARSFFAELSRNNDRVWFKANQARYTSDVLEPAVRFVEVLADRLVRTYPTLRWGTQPNGSGSILRIHRDVRFAKDKRPYKVNLGLLLWLGGGPKMESPGFYFHLEAKSAFFYGGRHQFTKPALERYRAAVDDPRRGAQLERVLADLAKAGLALYEEPAYKRVPRGYAADHPRGALLKLGAVGVARTLSAAETSKPDLAQTCARLAIEMRPLLRWLVAADEA